MRPLSAAKWLHYTSPVKVFYYIEFLEPFFFLDHFTKTLAVARRTYIAINYFFVCMCLHLISGVFGASGRGCLKSFSYDNLFWNIRSWQWTEEQSKLKWITNGYVQQPHHVSCLKHINICQLIIKALSAVKLWKDFLKRERLFIYSCNLPMQCINKTSSTFRKGRYLVVG